MRRRIRRAMAFALVPLSALPLVFAAPRVAPSFEQRIDELRGDQAPARTAIDPLPRRVSGPAVPPSVVHETTTPERRR